MAKSIYLIVFALLGHPAFLNAMEGDLDQQTPSLAHLMTEAHNSQKSTTNDHNEIDDDYINIGEEALNVIIAPDPKGLVNLKTIVNGLVSSWYQYGTSEMEKYDLAYNKLCTEAIKIYIENYRYLLKYLELSNTGTAQLFIGSVVFSYITFVVLSYTPAMYWNIFLENIDPFSSYVGCQSLFNKYHLIYQCNNRTLLNLALLLGILAVKQYNTTLKSIDQFLDRFPTENDTWDIKSKGVPLSQKQLLHSINKDACSNPLVYQMYPDALDMKEGRERSTGTFIAKVSRGISSINGLLKNRKRQEYEYDIPTLREIGKYNFWRIMNKRKKNIKLSDTEQKNYNAVIDFPLFRHEIGLTRLLEEPMNLPIILRKLFGFQYIFDKEETHMSEVITNVDTVIKVIAEQDNISDFEDQIFNQDIKTQKIIATFVENPKLKEELLSFTVDSTDNSALTDIKKAKLFLKELMQEGFVLDTHTS